MLTPGACTEASSPSKRERVDAWQSAAGCARIDGAGSSPALSFDGYVAATHRLRKVAGRD